MGRQLYDAHPEARELFDRAEAVLELPLRRLCFEGPEEELTATQNAQPALFTVSAIYAALLRRAGLVPCWAAGHSLGEYSALCAAEVFSFEDGLRAVRRRGELMAGVAASGSGGMLAVLGLAVDQVDEICREAAGVGVIAVANRNSPDQTVVSGETAALDTAARMLKEAGARRIIPLRVGAPFHCELMSGIAEEMLEFLREIPMQAPSIPVVANVTASPVHSVEEIQAALQRQMAGSVRWTDTIRFLAGAGVRGVVEAGPGRVLTGLTPRIVPEMKAWGGDEALAGAVQQS